VDVRALVRQRHTAGQGEGGGEGGWYVNVTLQGKVRGGRGGAWAAAGGAPVTVRYDVLPPVTAPRLYILCNAA